MHVNSQGVLGRSGRFAAGLRWRWIYLAGFLLAGFLLGAASSFLVLPLTATAVSVPLTEAVAESQA
ncbi:MAG: hypothetical protein NXI32_17215, partial [bacterium]|nr:hypothetical protein [bacterium]